MDQGNILNIRELLRGPASRLRNIVRFSNSHRISNETVAEHSFSTALYAMLICFDLNFKDKNGYPYNAGLAAMKAILHDIEESHSGDFIRTFKHSSPELRNAIESANQRFAMGIFAAMSTNLSVQLFELWKGAKDDTPEGKIVEFADFLSVVAYVYREARTGNVAILQDNGQSLIQYAEKFDGPRFEFIRPYVEQAREILHRINEGVQYAQEI